MNNVPREHRHIYEKYGTAPPIHATDSDGKVLYSDKDVIKLAEFSVKTGQFMRGIGTQKPGATAICSNCKEPSNRFFYQIFEKGWFCGCGTLNPPIEFPEEAKELSQMKPGAFVESPVEEFVSKYLKERA